MNPRSKLQTDLDSRYRSSIVVSVVFQALLLVAGVLAFDSGQLFRVAAVSLIPYWVITLLIAIRRPRAPTKFDLGVIRYGYPIIFCALYLSENFEGMSR